QDEYLGVGCAAHGHTEGRRWWNVRTPDRYIDAIARGVSPESGSETLDERQRAEERLTLGLRTRAGVPASEAGAHEAAALAEHGPPERPPDGRGVLTRAGRLLASDVTARLALASA